MSNYPTITGMVLGNEVRAGVHSKTKLEPQILALESQQRPTNTSLPWRNQNAGTLLESDTSLGAHHQENIKLSVTDLTIDYLDDDLQTEVQDGDVPIDIPFTIPSTHKNTNLSELPGLVTVNLADDPRSFGPWDEFNPSINDINELVDVDDFMESFFDFPAATVPDPAVTFNTVNSIDPYPRMVESPYSSVLNNAGDFLAPGLAMTAHAHAGNLMSANYTAGTMIASTSPAPPAAQVAAPSRHRHRCTTCQRPFVRRADRDRHALTHDTSSSRAFSCGFQGCHRVGSNGFWRLDKLKEHRNNMRH